MRFDGEHKPRIGSIKPKDGQMSTRSPKGTGSIRERDGRYQARFSFIDGTGKRRQRSEMFDKRTAARTWLNERLAAVGSGRIADAGTLTVGDYLKDWLGSLGMQQLEAATVSWYRSAVERHIIPVLVGVKLAKLSADADRTLPG